VWPNLALGSGSGDGVELDAVPNGQITAQGVFLLEDLITATLAFLIGVDSPVRLLTAFQVNIRAAICPIHTTPSERLSAWLGRH
jgi:hypothetical protein